ILRGVRTVIYASGRMLWICTAVPHLRFRAFPSAIAHGRLRRVTIGQGVEPGDVGLSEGQLRRVDTHFARYVDDGRLAGWRIVVTRRGKVAHVSTYGQADVEAGRPVANDTLWRVYSMTKPITSVAAMMLWEEGRFELTDEISRWLPEFAGPRVYDKGSILR